MILHPGAHFGDFPHPIGSGESRPFRLFPEPSPLARADFASSPPRRTPASRAFHGRRGSLSYTLVSRLSYPAAAPRRDSADSAVRWKTGLRGGKIGRFARRRGC
ncbi:hypothetical protein ALC56_08824 [Trachymyrmex septentrionalis]|uniref:Uncharacterized protein n=1 Tax=Trachymyrmex septentrionalis TaxID=34720 RepID=A0A195F9B6_9HYME|nr:hypothetical protein ALC56_08824 [Trachymyrmex septentrionalis]